MGPDDWPDGTVVRTTIDPTRDYRLRARQAAITLVDAVGDDVARSVRTTLFFLRPPASSNYTVAAQQTVAATKVSTLVPLSFDRF